MQNLPRAIAVTIVIVLLCGSARAEDAYYSLPVKDLKTADGKIPEPNINAPGWQDWRRTSQLEPSVRVDSPVAEAYMGFGDRGPVGITEQSSVVLRGPAGVDLSGRIFVPNAEGTGMVPVKFIVPATSADPKNRVTFYDVKRKHYGLLMSRRLPGAAWFRYQYRLAAAEAGIKPDDATPRNPNWNGPNDEWSDTVDLFSGGRAVSENLQLDRALFPRPGGDWTVPIDSLKGIDVKEMDWKPLIAGLHPTVDKLATIIPGDQHGIFFPSFSAAMKAFDEADLRATPIVEQLESSSQDAGTRARYRRQLCLPDTALGRFVGPEAIAAVAITGSDPYLRVGSDVAVLFEPKGGIDLHSMLWASMTNASAEGFGRDGPAEVVKGDTYTGLVSPGRRICAYLATIDGIEVVSNSLVQIQRMQETLAGKSPSLSSAREYTFFRNRYPRTDADETAFAILPDAAIRRWCSPKWRIADSRRTRAAGVMADMQASHVDALMSAKPDTIATTEPSEDKLTMTPAGVRSSTYGTLDFMTPISELQIDKVTQTEANMYNRWRDTYQQNWSNYFDPIGARFSVTSARTAVDVSVIPLIAGSDYAEIVALSKGAKIGADTGDRHPDLFHIALVINRDSQLMKQGAGFLTGFGGVQLDPLGWLGPTVALYVDEDPIWKKLTEAENPDKFAEAHFTELPVVLYLQSSNPLKLTGFLVALHAFVDASAPGQAVWTPVKYGDFIYTKISPSEQAKAGNPDFKDDSICYAVAGGALLLSPDEDALRRAIDRQSARVVATTQPAAATQPANAAPWLGENLCAQINLTAAEQTMRSLFERDDELTVQEHAWANLPILNEWHQHFPTADPVAVEEKLFQTLLLDPAGGKYVWNDSLQTMESTNYGCPESPKKGPILPTGLAGIGKANFGITFENDGMRARFELQH